jgi:hypothetical protein
MRKILKKSSGLNLRLLGVFFTGLSLLTITTTSGCQSESRVFYEGKKYKKITSKAELTALTPAELAKAGYCMIGTFVSEPTTHGQSVSKQELEKNPKKVLDSIAPENVENLKSYYKSLDEEVCRIASEIGGEKVRLEKIERTYPEIRTDIAELMDKALASDLTVKNVTSVKHWSVWRHKDLDH